MKKLFWCLAALWLALNLLTLTGYPAVWVDEILSADAGIHLARGQGFVSSGWFNQTSYEFWASYPPLYAFVLAGWLKLAPITAFFVRSFGLLLICVSLATIYRALSGLADETTRWLIIAALAVCEPLAFLERAGRPDSVSFVLFACTLLVIRRRGPNWALFVLGFLAVPAALQYAAFVLLLGALAQIWFRGFTRKQALLWISGLVCGAATLAAVYASQHVLRVFLQSTVASKHSSAGRWLQSLLLKNGEAPFVFSDILTAPLRDYSSPLIIAAGVAAWFWARRAGNDWAKRASSFGIACGVLIPLAIQILGKYPIYYAYMGTAPAAIAVIAAYGRLGLHGKRMACAVLGLITLSGAGRFWWMAWHQGSQSAASMAQTITSEDTLVVDYPVYYDFIGRGREIFAAGYAGGKVLPRFPREQADRVTKLIVRDSLFPELVKRIGGDWRRQQDLTATNKGRETTAVAIDDDTRHPTRERIGIYVRSKAIPK